MNGVKMNMIEVTAENIQEEYICCAIGNNKKNKERAETTEEYIHLLAVVAEKQGIPIDIKKTTTYKEAQKQGCPFGTFSIYYKNKILTHELMNEKKFLTLIDKLDT